MNSVSLKMVLRRSSVNCKLKTRVAFISLLLIFITMTLLYRALSSEDRKGSQLFPTMDKRRPIRFHSKHNVNLDVDPQFNVRGEYHQPGGYFEDSFKAKERDLLSADSRKALSAFLGKLYPTNWVTAAETDDVALEMKYLLLDYGFESKMSCKDMDDMRVGHAVTYTRTKFIEYVLPDSRDTDSSNRNYDSYSSRRFQTSDVAVKSPSNDIDTKIECMKQIYDADFCAEMGNYRFLREVLLMAALHHPGIPILKGYCLRGKSISNMMREKGLLAVTDVGKPLTQSVIETSGPRRRLSFALQISELLNYMDASPLGSLRLSKFQLKDFVLFKGDLLKLVDLDDLRPGERRCSSNNDCLLTDGHNGVVCSGGVCEGINSLSNLDIVSKQALLPLLHGSSQREVERLVEKLQNLNINIEELVSELRLLYKKAPLDPPPVLVNVNPPVVNEALGWKQQMDSFALRQAAKIDNGPVESMNANPQPAAVIPDIPRDDDLNNFKRLDMLNFHGLYDYPCAGSRVSWGCVFTVTSLRRAATLCYTDPACKGFVTFSSRPEEETLMTILLKNDTDSSPQTSTGTTLFVRLPKGHANLRKMESEAVLDEVGQEEEEEEDEDEEEEDEDEDNADDNTDEGSEQDLIAVRECLEKSTQVFESARYSREKRLMTHLGLKGIREETWRRSATDEAFGNLSRIAKAEGGGGKFQVALRGDFAKDLPPTSSKVTFVAEDGPQAYHLAYALAYHLDRVLGFYHTPPCIGKTLFPSDLRALGVSSSWEETFRPLMESDGSLTGIMMTSVPRVMKLSTLTLQPKEAMTSEVISFERPDKLQLEYMILSWLSGIDTNANEHLGYKGHLIHFNADQAFQNTGVDFSGYLNHCQFPNVAYRALLCFQCSSNTNAAGSSICHLGDEAVSRVRSMFDDELDLLLHKRTENALKASINSVASHILLKVNRCIKKFGKTAVLY